jgi:hypothetical protein
MWWHDIAELKVWAQELTSRITNLELKVDASMQMIEDANGYNHFSDRLSEMDDTLDKIKDEFPKFHKLANPEQIVETYQKHLAKMESMMLEFKVCVFMARSAIAEKKEQQKDFDELKNTTKIAKEIYEAMRNFISAGNSIEQQKFFKLDAIYQQICEKNAKKPKKKVNLAKN